MIETSEKIVALTAALIKVQGGISGVNKNATNPHFKNRYANLENVIDTARPALQEAGIAFVQAPGQVIDGSVEITTMLVHSSGEWMRSTLHVPLGKRDAQGVGSAITYGCRYSLMAMLGLPPTDDDGEAAVERFQTPNTVTGPPIKPKSSAALKREDVWPEFVRELAECETVLSLQKLALAWSPKADTWTPTWRKTAKDMINERREELLNGAPDDDTFPPDRANGGHSNILAGG